MPGPLSRYVVATLEALGHRFAANRRLIALLVTLSVAASLALAASAGAGHQIDFDIYRMGAGNVSGRHLYDTRLPRSLMGGPRGMRFTYPPFAALLFWPFTLFSVSIGQLSWSVINAAALAVLIAVSIKAVRPGWPWQRAWITAAVVLYPALWLDPALLTLDYGQVNLLIAAMILSDLTLRTPLPRGVAVGIAAAVKLTPLIFIPFLLLARQYRAGVTALSSFLACTLAAYAIAPAASSQYWLASMLDSRRYGNVLYISNQDLRSALQRIAGAASPAALAAVAVAVVAIGGLIAAAAAYRNSSPMLGIVTCAATGLVISPVSWSHHYVWVVPAMAWMALGEDRPPAGPWLAVLTGLLFWSGPIWWVSDPQTGYGGFLTFLEGNSYLLAAVTFVAGSAIRAVRRHRPLWHPRVPAHQGQTAEPPRSTAGTAPSSVS